MDIQASVKPEGIIKNLTIYKKDGTVKENLKFKNTVLLNFFHHNFTFSGGSWASYQGIGSHLHLGTGTDPSSFSMDGLSSPAEVGGSIVRSSMSDFTVTADRENNSVTHECTMLYRSDEGTVAGTWSELGLYARGTEKMVTRTLIKDGNGNPKSITVLSDEFLEVEYLLRITIKMDTEGSFNLYGKTFNYKVFAHSHYSDNPRTVESGNLRIGGLPIELDVSTSNLKNVTMAEYFNHDSDTFPFNLVDFPKSLTTEKTVNVDGYTVTGVYTVDPTENDLTIGSCFTLGSWSHDSGYFRSVRYSVLFFIFLDDTLIKPKDERLTINYTINMVVA